MRRNLLITFVMFAMCTFGMAQTVVFSDNFDSYTAGSHLAQSNSAWTTWNNSPGSAEDGIISNAQAASAPNSLHVLNSVDQIYPFHNYNNGHYIISFNMYVATSDNGAYFNIQKGVQDWAFGCYFYNNGTGYFKVGGDSTSFTYPSSAWFPVTVDINLNEAQASISINNTVVDTWPFNYSENYTGGNVGLSAIDFYASGPGNSTGEYYVDDFAVTEIIPCEDKIPIIPDTLWLSLAPDDTTSVDLTINNPAHRGCTYDIYIAYDVPEPDMTSTGAEELKWYHMNDTDTTLAEFCGSTQHELAVLFAPIYISDYQRIGKTIQSIRVPLADGATNAKIRIYDIIKDIPHSSFDFIPSDILYEQAFNPVEGINEVILNTPFVIDGGGFCIGVWVEHPDTCYMVYSDNGPYNWFSFSKTGETSAWERTTSHNFMISAIIDGTPITPWLDANIYGVVSASSSSTCAVRVNSYGMNVGEAHSAKIHCYASAYENRRVVPVYLSVTHVSVNEHNQIEVALYPNPATDFVQITSDQILSVKVFNLSGQLLFDGKYHDSRVVIPTTNFAAGTYLVEVTTKGGKTTKKVVVR